MLDNVNFLSIICLVQFSYFLCGVFMKNLLLILTFLITISFQLSAQWVTQQISPIGYNVSDVFLIDSMNIILVGDSIYKSTDGGMTWNNKTNENFIGLLNSVFFIDSDIGWACGDGILLKTTDAGETWSQFPWNFSYFSDVFFTSKDNGWLATFSGIYKTTNGGNLWQIKSQGDYYQIKFVNTNLGWATGYYPNTDNYSLVKTTDNGNTWNEKYIFHNNTIGEFSFVSELTGWTIDNDSLMKTTDGGDSWHAYPLPTSSNSFFEFVDSLNGIVFGYSIYKTIDGGLSWLECNSFTHSYYFASSFFNKDIGMLIGRGGTLLKTIDGGSTWEDHLKIVDANLSSIQFINQQTGWIAGYDGLTNRGLIFKTINNGLKWDKVLFDSLTDIKSLHFVDENNGLALATKVPSTEVLLMRTTDSGDNWENKVISELNYAEDCYFLNESVGWVISRNGWIYKTTNGGDSWIEGSIFEGPDLYSIQFINDSVGWISAEKGIIYKTIDGGFNWNIQQLENTGTTYKIFFVDSNVGWGIFQMGYDFFLIKTVDGGKNWASTLLPPNEGYRSLYFIDDNIGWVSGEFNIYYTTNSGNTWDAQLNGIYYTTNNIYFSDQNSGWAVGSGDNRILHTTNGGVTFIEEENNPAQPKQFLLQQNYPNPFNPSTTISYQIPKAGYVTLKVYDILGNEVTTLVNEEKPAGSYNVEFTMSNLKLSSGIYFYRLQAQDYIETKKMVLLK